MKLITSLTKIILILLVVSLNGLSLLTIGETSAYFNDDENSTGNNFQAGTLDFSLSSPQSNFGPRPEVVLNMMPGDSASREIKIQNQGSLLFQYNVQTEKISGDDDFCQGLQLFAQLEGVTKYSGGLMDFNFLAGEISGSEDNWLFIVFLPYSSNFQNKFCQFKFVFNGWQSDSSGFSDQEEISSQLASWGLRINEVYYDVDESHGSEGGNEWVEIYNQTNLPLDISGWKICDNVSCDTLPSASIPGPGFAVITPQDSTWSYWTITEGAVKIVLGSKIGNGLDNDSDRVILQRSDGQEIDAMSYGGDNYAFDPPASDVAEGHSLARRIAGFDTNQAVDWEELTNPNPGTNPHSMAKKEESSEKAVKIEEEVTEEEPIETKEEELADGEITEGQSKEEGDSQAVNSEEIDSGEVSETVNEDQEGLVGEEKENSQEQAKEEISEDEISTTEENSDAQSDE